MMMLHFIVTSKIVELNELFTIVSIGITPVVIPI